MHTHARTAKQKMDDIVFSATVAAGDILQVYLGTYERTIPQPDFHITIEQGSGEGLIAYLERNDSKGDYALTYHLDNATGAPCNITIREHF